jgi:hypothetical protein
MKGNVVIYIHIMAVTQLPVLVPVLVPVVLAVVGTARNRDHPTISAKTRFLQNSDLDKSTTTLRNFININILIAIARSL